MVYGGVLAGTANSRSGGASDYVCLPCYPQYSTYSTSTSNFAKLVPAEYEHPVTEPYRHNHNARCAVCQTTRTDVMMIPACTSCYYGWTLEYQGYLMTESDTNVHSTKFICVDRDYSILSGSAGNTNPATDLFHLEVDCSSGLIPCSSNQYNRYKEVTCAVCTR